MIRRWGWIALGATAAVGIAAVAVTRHLAPQEPAVPAARGTVSAPAADARPPAPAAPAATTGTPPWARGDGASEDAAPPAADERERRMAELRQSLDKLVTFDRQRMQAQREYLLRAMDALEASDDPRVRQAFNLDAMRHNVNVALRAQELAAQLQEAYGQPESPERQARIDALTAQLRALQGQLRTDVQRQPLAATPPSAPGGAAR